MARKFDLFLADLTEKHKNAVTLLVEKYEDSIEDVILELETQEDVKLDAIYVSKQKVEGLRERFQETMKLYNIPPCHAKNPPCRTDLAIQASYTSARELYDPHVAEHASTRKNASLATEPTKITTLSSYCRSFYTEHTYVDLLCIPAAER